MPRLPRVSPVGVSVHLIQRGNNRQACFASEEDFGTYLAFLKEYADKYRVDIHAWVLMTNHVHLLCIPRAADGVSKMMQGLGRRYVQYFNFCNKRSGTLWEGRFKSCLVQNESYVLQVYRYIETNPLRAGMVSDPAEYRWSSYQFNALGIFSNLGTYHQDYLLLGKTGKERKKAYRHLFKHDVESELLTDIRTSTQKGLAIGNDRFKKEIEKLTGRRMRTQKRGRPVGWRKREV